AGTVLSTGGKQTLSVSFAPTDSANYTTATQSVTINVGKATPVITWANPADITAGTALGATQLNATANTAGTFTYSPAAGTVLSTGGKQTLSVSFAPTDSANYTTATQSVTINVGKATPVITWANPPDVTSGTVLGATQLNATANTAGTFTYSPAAGTVLSTGGNQTLSVNFAPTDSANYTTATQSVTINVGKATPVITWANPANIAAGTALSGTQLNATATVAGTFAYAPAAGAVLSAGNAQTLSVSFTPTDTADYTTATKSVLINVTAVSTSVSTPSSSLNPSTYGQAVTFSATVTSSGGTPTGTLQFFDGPTSLGTAVLSNGIYSLTTSAVSAGTRSITAAYSGDTKLAASTSPALTQTVNKASTTSSMTTNPAQAQYSDLMAYQATLTPTSAGGQPPATGVIFKIGTQQLNATAIPLTNVNGVLTATLSNYALLETVAGQLQPGTRSVTATFTGVSPNFTVTNVTKSISITREDARTSYSGPTAVHTTTPTVGTATIPITATIKDITAVTGDPAWDANPGNISLAQVSFVNRATGATIGTANVVLNNPNDPTVGTATFNWSVDIGTATSQSFTIGTVVTGYYTRNSTTENAIVTVSH
ncbi:MAG: Ig-like domain repeat protein, partial [Terriglobales bacterium]